jgi:hypothetical protein
MENTYGTGNGADTITSGLEGAWTTTSNLEYYFENLFGFEWELTKSSWSTPFKPLAMLVLEPFLMRMTQRKHINLSYSD